MDAGDTTGNCVSEKVMQPANAKAANGIMRALIFMTI
jgi:hypothetical protein